MKQSGATIMYRSIEEVFKKWKDEPNRLPIILRGARQVGKSYIIEKFGSDHFDTQVTINFDFQPELCSYFENLDPIQICSKLETALNQRIIPGKTLLFFDEIQNCPKALLSLRYFKEKLNSLHVMAAGSLLEFVLHEERFSFPVGRVQSLYLKPLSFREYLLSLKQESLIHHIDTNTLDQPFDPIVHEKLLQHVREYFLIGGMPAVVQCFLEKKSFLECQQILKILLETYRNDFSKYASKTQYKYLQTFFEKVPGLVAQNFKYSHIDPELRSRELKIALEQLEWAGLVHRVIATSASGIPLQTHAKENKLKLLFLDIGLLNTGQKLDIESIWQTNLTHLNVGIQAEQFVGQELLAYEDVYSKPHLFFWNREKQGALAEVDYVIQSGSHILPVEVKAGTTGRLKSLSQFIKEKKSPFGIRISQHPLSYHDQILSIPFYMIDQIPRLTNGLL